jgi:hypothetical protein
MALTLLDVVEILAKRVPWTASDAEDADAVFEWIRDQKEKRDAPSVAKAPAKGVK